MLSSPLMDATRFARDIETAYRQMWLQWCVQNRGATDRRRD
jgi:predicted O-linked N-acetylglucosamine transferase (SPINDLY family)